MSKLDKHQNTKFIEIWRRTDCETFSMDKISHHVLLIREGIGTNARLIKTSRAYDLNTGQVFEDPIPCDVPLSYYGVRKPKKGPDSFKAHIKI